MATNCNQIMSNLSANLYHINCHQWLEVLDELNIGAMTVDIQHKITAINHCAQSLIGLKTNEVVACDCREVFTGVPCRVPCILDGEQPEAFSDSTIHFTDEDQHEYAVTRIATPIYNDQKEVAGCLTILQDHSPISDLIDRLRYEERSLKNILDSLDVGVFAINRGGLLTFFNTAAERISGYLRDEVLGKPHTRIFKGIRIDSFISQKVSDDSDKHNGPHSVCLIAKYGDNIPIRASYMALKNEKGAIVGGLTTFQDMILVNQVNQAIHQRYTFRDMIGKSPTMQRLFDMIPMVAESHATVLIEGATGTGKDLLAKIIHGESPRCGKPWVKINCAAVPENLLESEFFGYVKGAFTGAVKDKPGRFQDAHNGTIFLDEIGDLPLALQAKLLRVLEDHEFYPLGARKTEKVDVRVISATNRNLEALISQRLFREDLYYRLNVVRLKLPTLNQRREDLSLLIHHVLRKLSAVRGTPPPAVARQTLQILLNYDYPGNVRELENILEHAMVLCRKETMEPNHLPDYVRLAHPPAISFSNASNKDSMEAVDMIMAALKRTGGHRGKAAAALGMDRTTLWRKMKRLGIS